MLLISVLTVILSAAAVTAFALVRKKSDNRPDGQGHLLTSLWNEYHAAMNADKPREASVVLDKIISKAKAERLHFDFYDAAASKVTVESSRNWKNRELYKEWFDKKVKEYDEPVVTFRRRFDNRDTTGLTDFVIVNKTRLQAGRNQAFYSCSLDNLWTSMFKDDYEYALWALALPCNSGKAASLLQDYLDGAYPKAAYLEYNVGIDKRSSVSDKAQADKMAACREFIRKYDGKAVSLYAKARLCRERLDSLSRKEFKLRVGSETSGADKASLEREYKSLYEDCKAAEKERLSYKTGVDRQIAAKIKDFGQLTEFLTSKKIEISFEDRTVVLVLRNLDKVDVSFALDRLDAKPLFKKTVVNPKKSFYVRDTVKVELPKCDDGDYVLTVRNGKKVARTEWSSKMLSIALRDDNAGTGFYVADYQTGEPAAKVDLELFRSGTSVAKVVDVALSKDGFTPLPEAISKAVKNDAASVLVASYRDSDGFLRKTDDHYIYGGNISSSYAEDGAGSFCAVFSDKSAYNPGEKLSFKSVLYKEITGGDLRVFNAGTKVKAELINPDGKTVAETDLATNEYGSVASSFDLPTDSKNGIFQLRITSDGVDVSKFVTVDEFVLPTYDLSFDVADKLHFRGDTVEVTGKVTSYSGHSLSSARVSYSVENYGTKVSSGPLALNADGSFSVRFGTSDAKGSRNVYAVTVKVADATGETKEFTRRIPVLNYFSLYAKVGNALEGEISLDRPGWYGNNYIVSGGTAEVTFCVNELSDSKSPEPVEVRYSLKDSDERVVLSGKTVSGKVSGIALPKPGLYRLDAEAVARTDKGKEITASSSVVLVRIDQDDTVLAAKVRSVISLADGCADGDVQAGGDISVRFGAGEGPVWAVVELFGDKKQLLEHRVVSLEGKAGESGLLTWITYKYKEEYPDAVRLNIFYFRDGSSVSFSREFRRAKERQELPLSFSSFTDKALPGTEYSLALKSLPGVEAVAAIFDKSSETIVSNVWGKVVRREFGTESVPVSVSTGKIRGRMANEDDVVVGYGGRRRMKSSRASVLYDSVGMNDMALEESAVAEAPMVRYKAISEDAVDLVPEVAVRSDFSSTLAFEPFLRSDADGNIFLKFRTSDKLSTFVAQVWAHTPEMLNAAVRGEFVVTVPVKVSVVEPKYLYRGDKLTLHVSVSNNSEASVSGVAALQTFPSKDYQDAKPVASQARKVTVPAGGSVEVQFDVDPKNYDELGLKVVFADNAKTFSDGVFVSVPVYEARQTLTESHSAVLSTGADRTALIRRLESEFTGATSHGAEVKEIDIRQMLLDAVPSKVEPKGKDVLSLSEALYVRQVARRLGSDIEAETSDESIVERIKACMNADGGFGWFEGFRSSPTVTAVLLERFAKMRDAGLDFGRIDLNGSVKWLDRNQFLRGGNIPRWCDWLSMEQYAFVRSMYPSVAFDVTPETKIDKSEYPVNFKAFKKSLKDYLLPSAKDGRGLDGQILAKARRIKTLANLEGSEDGLPLAKAWGLGLSASSKMDKSITADIQSLLEYAVEHPDGGMYYPNAVMPWRGLLESEAYAHALLCDLMSSRYAASAAEPASETVRAPGYATAGQVADGIRLWLMLQKETQKWDDDPAFVDALNSVLSGSDRILSTKVVSLTKTYSAPFSKVAAAGNGFSVERHFYKEVTGENGKIGRLEIVPGMRLNVGDKITAEYRIWNQENRSFVRLTAPREAAFRPVEQLSGYYGWRLSPLFVSGAWSVTPQGYRNVRADETEYMFDVYPEDKTVVSEDFFITQEGIFTAPVVTIESLYSPHYRANDAFGGLVKTSK